MDTYQIQVNNLKNQIIAALNEFFGTREGVRELYLKSQPTSAMDDTLTIMGVLRSPKQITLIQEDDFCFNTSYERIENCHINDLAYVLDELKAGRFSENHQININHAIKNGNLSK